MTDWRYLAARLDVGTLVVRVPPQILPGKSNRVEVAYFFVSLRPSPIDWSHILASPHRREIETEPAKFCAIGENGKSVKRHHVMPSRDQGLQSISAETRNSRPKFWRSVSAAAAQEMPVAVRRHPFGAGQMAFPCLPSTGGLLLRIDLKNDPRNLGPIRALGIGIKKPQISDEVLLVITRQRVSRGRSVGNFWGE